jgi:starvation-inducible DNA-binding protein
MTMKTAPAQRQASVMEGQPRLQLHEHEIQSAKQLRSLPLGMPEETIGQSVTLLNQLLADTITLYDLYKRDHWHIAGPTFYQLHLLFDKHAEEVEGSIDLIAERIQMLGGVTAGMPFEVAERTKIERPPSAIERVSTILARTVSAHATIIHTIREGVELTQRNKDYGTNDLLVSGLLRMHEMHVWFISQHLISTPIMSEEDGPRSN